MNGILKEGARIGIVCCSNGINRARCGEVDGLEERLRMLGFCPVLSDHIYEVEGSASGGTAQERAQALMEFYRDDGIDGIFDISGGDLANGILPYLDYDVIADSDKMFWGYSDLTTVINAIYAKTGRASALYQIRNLIYDHGARQTADFKNTVTGQGDDLFRIKYRQLARMRGIVVGGNIRCFLKLAGTEYMPDLQDKVLLLESYSGSAARIETYLCQLEQLGAFRMVAGIVLGTFTEMQEKKAGPPIDKLVRRFAGEKLPIAVTDEIGHGTDAKGIVIGQEFRGIRDV